MGSSGGGGRYTGPPSESIRRRIQRAREQERQRLEGQVNDLLQHLLAQFNDRNRAKIGDRLSEIQSCLTDTVEIDRILFGGSVAKHTDVDGISDVDALVVLERQDLAGKPPKDVLDAFLKTLRDSLPRQDIRSIEKGRLAVTVTYDDGLEMQLLPALRTGQTIAIAAPDGRSWSDTQPRLFERELTKLNQRLNCALVPTIKLFKSIISTFPEQKRLSGYHIESLLVDAAKDYEGPKTPRALLLHALDHASQRVLKPLRDVTGQSRTVDAYLGPADSLERRNVSLAVAGMKRRLEAATTVAQWRSVFDES
ncbi:MAG: nucleotidyltransferase [Deltaproteobacteria bacterium]|nr:nucleotidyltransferase [Deltaproteobacteria bacterium]